MIKKILQYINLKFFRFFGRLKARIGLTVSQKTPDREILEKTIFSYIFDSKNKITLFVGIDFYTKHYVNFFNEDDFWTIDFNPKLQPFGAKNHICDRYENIETYLESTKFDFIICNGVIGYGTNSIEELDLIISTSYRLLKSHGLLIIGWNDRPESNQFDPRESKALNVFSEFIFPPLNSSRFRCNEGSSHVYDFYKKNNNIS